MRITLNLTAAVSTRDALALPWAIPATLVGLVALVLLGRASVREYRANAVLQQQLAEVQARREELRNQEAAVRRKFEHPAYSELLRRTQFVNGLIEQKELSLTELSARLAGLLPEDARLTGLLLTSPRRPGEDYMVRIGISARGEEAVETFVNDLEDSSDFKDVSIVNQGFQEESSQARQINLICTARYLPGVEQAWEESSQEPEVATEPQNAQSRGSGAAAQKPKVGRQESEPKGQKSGVRSPAPEVGTQKVERPRAQNPTPNR